jgi:thiol-disulfide isomerase/thioredoxin
MTGLQILCYALTALVLLYFIYVVYKWMTGPKKENFQDTPSVFRMFYVDWCGHCARAKPEFKKILNVDEVNGKPLQVLMINAEENAVLSNQFQVRSYPTFILTKSSGENITYTGLRSEGDFMNFLKSTM